jgi:hypothetical protein
VGSKALLVLNTVLALPENLQLHLNAKLCTEYWSDNGYSGFTRQLCIFSQVVNLTVLCTVCSEKAGIVAAVGSCKCSQSKETLVELENSLANVSFSKFLGIKAFQKDCQLSV